jgi:superfamily II DNA/RNA helicase
MSPDPNAKVIPSRDDLATEYLSQFPFSPYPFQEEALLAWFTADQGIMVCAPTGMGKTMVAEAAMFEAIKSGKKAYYTTPLIALTEQKFAEMQARVVAWGFSPNDVGLVTGNRRVNPDAPLLVVVAEILLNRLLAKDQFDFEEVHSVVMDEFHSFNDAERGVVWELTLGLLPSHVKTLLLSATVGNAYEFSAWLRNCHHRDLTLIQSNERKVPLAYYWIPDQTLHELLVQISAGPESVRRTPALVFCFNRDECWDVAEQIKGKELIDHGRQALIDYELRKFDWSQGAGPKLKQVLIRGVGVHHAGILPKYRRIVEDFFNRKLLSIVVCTETLAAGINLPARTVVLPTIMTGPFGKKRLIEPASAQQMFGRAGRPQFDSQGFVYALPHEDDVKLLRWRAKYDQIPDDTKDPNLRRVKKSMKQKMPRRNPAEQYWTEEQFVRLQTAPPAKLESKGALPWRLLAHLIQASSDVEKLRNLVSKRLLAGNPMEAAHRQLDRMLMILYRGGFVRLEPAPPEELSDSTRQSLLEANKKPAENPSEAGSSPTQGESKWTLFGQTLGKSSSIPSSRQTHDKSKISSTTNLEKRGGPFGDVEAPKAPLVPTYRATSALATERIQQLEAFRSINPLFGVFLIQQLGIADQNEVLQALESTLELPGPVARFLRVPRREELPPGALAQGRLDEQLLRMGLASVEDLMGTQDQDEESFGRLADDGTERKWPLTFAEKLRLLFQHENPGVEDLFVRPVWVAGELLIFGGDFNQFILSRRLQKQEGIVFRHLLRLILLLGEFAQLSPSDKDPNEWRQQLRTIQDALTTSCRKVDPASTEKILEEAAEI